MEYCGVVVATGSAVDPLEMAIGGRGQRGAVTGGCVLHP